MDRRRNIIVLVLLLLIVGVMVVQFRSEAPPPQRISISELAHEIESGTVDRISVEGDEAEVLFWDFEIAHVRIDSSKTLVEQMVELGVPPGRLSADNLEIEIKDPGTFNDADWPTLFLAGGAGFVLGVLVMLTLVRTGYFHE